MSAKDKYNNNIRRGARVKDLSVEELGQGTVIAASGTGVLVAFDDHEPEQHAVDGKQLVCIDATIGRR